MSIPVGMVNHDASNARGSKIDWVSALESASRSVGMKAPDRFAILKEIKLPLVIALMGFIGGITGSLLGPYLSAQREKEKGITELRVAAYRKFFGGQAKLLQVRYGNASAEEAEKLMREYGQDIKEARFQVGVFGSPEVIRALVNWFRVIERGETNDPNLWREDVKIYQAIRHEILGRRGRDVDDDELYDLLFRYQPPASGAQK